MWGRVVFAVLATLAALGLVLAVVMSPALGAVWGGWRLLNWTTGLPQLPGFRAPRRNGRLDALSFQSRRSLTVVLVTRVFELLRWFSAGRFVQAFARWRGGRRRDWWIEGYVVVGAAMGIIVLALLGTWVPFRDACSAQWWIGVAVAYRLAEIFVTAWNVHVFDRLRGDRSRVFRERQLILNLVNYGEIVVLFAILWALVGQGLGPWSGRAWAAFERSIHIATMTGFNGVLDEHWIDRVLFVSETAMALMFILFVLVRAVSVIRPRQ